MKRFSIRQPGMILTLKLVLIGAIALSGCNFNDIFPTIVPVTVSPTITITPTTLPISSNSISVRGYLAAAVGNSADPETSGGLYAEGVDGKEIFLPGITVYLEDPQNNIITETAQTDLSGRFTLFAPVKGLYRICWKSSVYGDNCTSAFVRISSSSEFLSTVHIWVPRKSDYVAVMGHITTADGALSRTFDPLLNINAFATVSLDDENGDHIADAYVNNFGDYLLPYVPVKTKLALTATIESEKFTQEIWPEAEIETSQLNQIDLKFENSRPRLDPIVAVDLATNRRVQNAMPGSTVKIEANARDKDGDLVDFVWFLDPSEGQLSQTTGSTVEWEVPSIPGTYSITVVAYDNRGGYDKATLSVLTDDKGVPFTGMIVDPNGTPIVDASVEIVGNPVIQTDANGLFQTVVKATDRYVFNVRKEGYALNSQIYDRSVTGGKWILYPAQIVVVDPTQDIAISHARNPEDCLGPASLRANLGMAGKDLQSPQWQDGQGNIIDPPLEREKVVMPFELQLTACKPGISVEIPANSILDPRGNPATTPIQIGISTIDLFSPQQMPGDESVVTLSGDINSLQSAGAGAVDLPPGYSLRAGATAKITIPVDRGRLLGGALPPTIPLLSYDEQNGLWKEEGTLSLTTVSGVQAYEGDVTHFTTYNADTLFTDNACVRVFSPTLPGNYDLEVMSPYPNGSPHYKNYPIVNVGPFEHVIYNITPNVNITLAPMVSGQLLGFYVVNSGPPTAFVGTPGVGNVPPGPPYVDCQNFVVLKAGNAPDSSFGGEFLHGLGYINAANLGFDDLTSAAPTGNALRDAIVTASKNYYSSIDPNNLRTNFDDFKTHNGFNTSPNVPVPNEVVAQFANTGDLGFGRDMHCLKKANGDIACYVTNYGTGYSNIAPGGGTSDQDDANNAGQRNATAEIATVAMEYSPIENDPVGDKVVKFYVYKKGLPNYGRSISANLDGRGERPVPQLCMICHGGQIPSQVGGIPAFSTAAQVKLGARFLPFDYRMYTFPTTPALPASSQDAAFKSLNETIVDFAPPGMPATDPIREVVRALYNDATHTNSPTQLLDSPVPGWQNGQSLNLNGQTNFYNKVLANACRTCHIAQPFSQLQFNTSDKFVNVANAVTANNRLMLGTAQLRVCGDYVMAHALRTHEIFWGTYTDIQASIAGISMPLEFQTFGDGVGGSTWRANLCTSFISGTVPTPPSQFYQQTIQPIWNGKCVACHVNNGAAGFLPLTEGVSYGELVPSHVVAFNDNPSTLGNILLDRITRTGAGRMPQNCVAPPTPPGPNQLPCLQQSDIDNIKAWIRNGAR